MWFKRKPTPAVQPKEPLVYPEITEEYLAQFPDNVVAQYRDECELRRIRGKMAHSVLTEDETSTVIKAGKRFLSAGVEVGTPEFSLLDLWYQQARLRVTQSDRKAPTDA